MKNRIKTYTLTLLLLKQSLSSFEEALRNPSSLYKISLKPEMPFTGEFYYTVRSNKEPSWKKFVAPALIENLFDIGISSVSGVLFIKVDNRSFAFTFGHGRSLLKPDSYEHYFGLKVALNRIEPDRLRSLDLRTYEDMLISTRKQTSKRAELATFGLDLSRDLLRAVTGEPKNTSFAKRITGADALTITVKTNIEQLGNICKKVLEAYIDNKYKTYFEWVDYLKEVRDPEFIYELNQSLLDRLKQVNTENLNIVPPEPIDWQDIDKFRISGTGKTEYDDLDIDAYLIYLGDKRNELTIDKLKSYSVFVRRIGADSFYQMWSLYKCLLCEISHKNRFFVLIEGIWFEIDNNFSNQVRNYIKSKNETSLTLPDAWSNENEKLYNQRVAQTLSNVALLDTYTIKPQGATTRIEFCDLLTSNKEIIHVKKRKSSATLSHLFSQGTISSRVFLQDGSFRDNIKINLEKIPEKKHIANVIPGNNENLNPSSFKIVFAIITKHINNWPLSLPFFTQLNFMQNAKFLEGMGFKVTILKILEK